MSEAEKHAAHRAWNERAALDGIIERLTRQFPELPPEAIANTVNGEYDGFRDSKVRDFVPILVERSARTELGHPGPRYRA